MEERNNSEKVIKNDVRTKRKRSGINLRDIFIVGDVYEAIRTCNEKIVLPMFVKMVEETGKNILHMVLYGNDSFISDGPKNKDRESYSRVSYDRSYDDSKKDSFYRRRKDNRVEYDEILFDSENDAFAVIDYLNRKIKNRGYATLTDIYSSVGKDGWAEYTDDYWGWDRYLDVNPKRTEQNGWYIPYPPAIDIRSAARRR